MKDFSSEDYLLLFSNCIPVKGAKRGTICDLQRERYFIVPLDLLSFLEDASRYTFKSLFDSHSLEDKNTIEEYLEFLFEHNLAHVTSDRECFPNLPIEWDEPSQVTNSVIDVDCFKTELIDYERVINELSNLNCVCIQFRFFSEVVTPKLLNSFLSFTDNTRINEVRLVLPFSEEMANYIVQQLALNNKRLTEVIFFGCVQAGFKFENNVRFTFITKKNLSPKSCGQICRHSFTTNVRHYTEAKHFNTCLNRKVGIDSNGLIKNCPSQEVYFGNVESDSIKGVLEKESFRAVWSIKKDQVSTCNICEFRYICTDCRVFISNPRDIFSKPLHCTYDPLSATWN